MPEMVALLNGFGGLASLIVGAAEFLRIRGGTVVPEDPVFTATVTYLTILIGGITFTGSIYALCKLAEWLSGRAMCWPEVRTGPLGWIGGETKSRPWCAR